CSGDTFIFNGIRIERHIEIVNGNNFILARIPTKRSQIAGVKIEAAVDSSGNSSQIKHRKLKNQGTGFPNYDIIQARPEDSWPAFNRMVHNNIKYPQSALYNRTEGVVVVGFTIDSRGKLQNLKIIKGIGNGCDEEALRVLTIPAKWLPAMQNGYPTDEEIEYSITFKLKLETEVIAKPLIYVRTL